MADYFDEGFKLTMSGLEKGLQVAHITTSPVQGCESDEEIATVLDKPHLSDFDMIPVRRNDKIVGIIKRDSCPRVGLASDCMHPLDESVLISAEVPLLEFINSGPLDRLVLRGTKIDGIVTRSDFLKLPVRLLGFSLVTHVETLMSNIIRRAGVAEQTWLAYLVRGRRDAILKKQKRLRLKHANPDLLEHTYFSDKRVILKQLLDSKETVIHELLDQEALDQLKEINELRNTVAHTGNDIESQDPIQDFIGRLRLAQEWISNFQDILAQQGESEAV